MGSIYRRKWKDKNGNIKEGKILWIKYYDRSGKPCRESTRSTKEADAKRLLKKEKVRFQTASCQESILTRCGLMNWQRIF